MTSFEINLSLDELLSIKSCQAIKFVIKILFSIAVTTNFAVLFGPDFLQVSYLVRVPQLSGTYLHFPPFLQGLLVAVHSPFSPWYWHRSPSNKSFLVGANLGWEQLQKKSLKEQKKIVNHKGLTWEEGFVMHIFFGGLQWLTLHGRWFGWGLESIDRWSCKE